MQATTSGARCRVCGSGELDTDEAFDRGLWLLVECRRCESRWTHTEPLPVGRRRPVRVPAGVGLEVAPAA